MADIIDLLREIDGFRGISESDVKITPIWKKENYLYFARIYREKLILKYSLKGWGEYELNAMKLLFKEGYPVPRPKGFVPEHEIQEADWAYGNVKRKVGLLVYSYVEGETLEKRLDIKKLADAIKLLKRFHDDERHHREKPFIPNYQQTEVGRAKYYLSNLSKTGYLSQIEVQEILKIVKSYERMKIDFKVIHGDFRPGNLIDSDDIVMIDFEGFSEGADNYKDLGIFIAELQRIVDMRNLEIDPEEIINIYSTNLSPDEKLRLDFSRIRRGFVFMKWNTKYRKKAKQRLMEIVQKQ